MTGEPRCDYVPMWSSPEHQCSHEALVRVLRRHRAGVNPEYKDRCLAHAASAFGPQIVAYRDPDNGGWRPTD